MSWFIQIQNLSGETKRYPLGKLPELSLRDESLALRPVKIESIDEESRHPRLRVRSTSHENPASVGGIRFHEAEIPAQTPVRIGDTLVSLEESSELQPLPVSPKHTKCPEWKTVSRSGSEMLWTTRKSASTSLAIYLEGETGSGKEVLARMIHGWSDRATGPFVAINCGALPLTLVESELFGHAKGAFTGAIQSRSGALMQAHGGTLFLDEIADLPPDVQVKLLRFLEDGEVRPVGADRVSHSQVRLVSATHKPLLPLVESGHFRRDLYYRIASISIQIPSLRERPEDVSFLAREFASQCGKTLSPNAVFRLQAHRWPGNVRELRHAIERASGMSGSFSTLLTEEVFDFLITPASVQASPELEIGAPILTLHEMEKLMLCRALKLCNGHRTEAAKLLGIARSTLFEMLKRHRIRGPRTKVTALELLQSRGLRSGHGATMHSAEA